MQNQETGSSSDKTLPSQLTDNRQPLPYPCSPAQQRFWVLDQLNPGDPALNIAVRWEISGNLPHAILEQAANKLIERHEVMRTYLASDRETLTQFALPCLSIEIPTVDLSMLSESEAKIKAEQLAQQEACTPINITIAPLLRFTRLQLSAQKSMLLLTIHHTVCDGWSVGIIADELGEICSALQHQASANLAPLEISYGDYSAWINEWQNDEGLGNESRFWLKQLSGAPYFELPSDFTRPTEWSNPSLIATRMLERPLTDQLDALSRQQGCTLYVTALTCLLTLMHRYTGETDICIGTQLAGRDEVETEALVGLFINTIVVRNRLDGDPGFCELLTRVQTDVARSFDNQAMPLEQIIKLLKPQRDPSRNPLFSVNFTLQRSFVSNRKYPEFSLIDQPSCSAGALYDLHFFMVERPEGWRLSCEYKSELFAVKTVETMLANFENIFRSVIATPNGKLSRLNLLDEEQVQRLSRKRGPNHPSYTQESVLEMFAASVANNPHSSALHVSNTALSYAELDQSSTELAWALINKGWGENQRIGILLPRSEQLPMALLAVLKCGSAYVPIDPRYPKERIAHIINDAGLVALISVADLIDHGNYADIDLHLLDNSPSADALPTCTELPKNEGTDLAYLIYTSGSTGLPKGVQISHAAFANFLRSMMESPGLEASDTLLALTTVAFDIAALELFLPLCVGAKVVIATEDDAVDGRRLNKLISQHSISVLQATPITWQLLLESGWQPNEGLKMLCGGEALESTLAEKLLHNNAELWNMYGPTETTIWSSALQLHSSVGPIPIGQPIANTEFYLLDQQRQLVPAGVAGELYIAGAGVSHGYRNRPQLNSDSFLNVELPGLGERQLYRTGDRMRWRSDGNLDFLGRYDQQVKVRGYRIELGEIESVILQHPAINQTAAKVGKNSAGEEVVWAFISPCIGAKELTILRGLLSQRLPTYMQPMIVELDNLPHTPNNKIDRNALVAPASPAHSKPLDDLDHLESEVADIWREILNWDEALHRESNFFDLGGHSLHAARMLSIIETRMGRNISLSQLFHQPTIMGIAELVRPENLYEDDFRQIVRMQSHGQSQPIIALHNTGTYFSISKHLGEDFPFTSLQLFDPNYPNQSLPKDFEKVAADYVDLIKRAQPSGPYFLLGWCAIGTLAFEIARQMKAQGESVNLVILDAWAPGHTQRMHPIKAFITNQYYRLLSLGIEFSRMLKGQQNFFSWFSHRRDIKRTQRLTSTLPDNWFHNPQSTSNERSSHLRRYGQWLFAYLERLMNGYVPKHYPGDIHLLRCQHAPQSRFLSDNFGWKAYADEVYVTSIEGDHWSMLKGDGAGQIADYIATLINARQLQKKDVT